MNLKQTLMASTAALLLTASFAQAQQSREMPAPTGNPSADAPAAPAVNNSTNMNTGINSNSGASGAAGVNSSTNMNSSSPSMGVSSTTAIRASNLHELKDKKMHVSAMSTDVKTLNAAAVYGADGKKIGEVDRVLGDSTNAAQALVVNAGGFLGMGTHEVVFPLDKLSKGKDAKHLQTALTKDQVKGLEKWEVAAKASSSATPAAKKVTN